MTFPTDLRDAAQLLARVHVDRSTDDGELLSITAEVERVGRMVDALRTSTAAEIARRSDRSLGREGLASRQGHRTPSALISSLTRVSGRQADRRARVGRLVEPFEALSAAVASGGIDTDAAESIATALTPVADRPSVDAEIASLLDLAASRSADEVAAAAKSARDRLDALGIEQRERDLRAQRYLRFGREVGGMVPLHGMLPPEEAGVVLALFDARTSVRRTVSFSPSSAESSGAGSSAAEPSEPSPQGSDRSSPAKKVTIYDDRTMDQRRVDTFVEICRVAADALAADSTDSPLSNGMGTLVVTIDHETLESGIGAARIDGITEPISAASARRIACAAGILPIVLDGRSRAIDLGSANRFFSAAQRRALALRDKGCAAPGCDTTPGWTEAHHITPWSRGGPTDLENGVLLCSFHHHLVHEGRLVVTVHDGVPEVSRALVPRPLAPRPSPPAGAPAWRTPELARR